MRYEHQFFLLQIVQYLSESVNCHLSRSYLQLAGTILILYIIVFA